MFEYGILISSKEERNQMKNTSCMNCGSSDLYRFIDLRDQPNGNHFPDAESKDTEPMFPFAMMVCRSCYQVQLEEFPSPEFMFGEHPYVTGINQPVVDHFAKMATKIVKRFEIPENSLVIDIGCNDGTLPVSYTHLTLPTIYSV